MRTLQVRRLGRVEYADGLRLMEVLRTRRAAGTVADTLLLLEHPPVVTLGRGAGRENLLAAPEELAAREVELFETERGGDVTYHGPGQIVGYAILDLSPDRRDVRRFVRDLEETMLRAAADFGVRAGRVEGVHGVWLGEGAEPASAGPSRKLGAVGVHLSRWITSHGFAFNVGTRLEDFGVIVPCGLKGRGVTSLEVELGRSLALEPVENSLARHLGEILGSSPVAVGVDESCVQVQLVREGAAGKELLALRRLNERGGFWQPVTGRVEVGEAPGDAAVRELREETGLEAAARPLSYAHAFVLERAGAESIAEESAFAAQAPPGFEPHLDPREHCEARWISAREAAALFPFAGLRRGAQLALAAMGRA